MAAKEPDEGGVVIFVTLLIPTPPVGGENGKGEGKEADAEDDDGGVVEVDGRCGCGRRIWEDGRGMGTRAETMCEGACGWEGAR